MKLFISVSNFIIKISDISYIEIDEECEHTINVFMNRDSTDEYLFFEGSNAIDFLEELQEISYTSLSAKFIDFVFDTKEFIESEKRQINEYPDY